MNQEQALSLLKETKLVAILRGIPVKQATDIATALYDGGVRVLEFTFDHDDPDCVAHNCQRIRAVKKIFGDEMVVGCGTALTVQEVEASIETLRNYIDWTPFFMTWSLAGKYPRILEDEVVGVEAQRLFKDANDMLDKLSAEKTLNPRGVVGLFPANRVGDDIEIYRDETRTHVINVSHHLRQQTEKTGFANYCLADFVAPKLSGKADYIGAFAVTGGLEEDALADAFEAQHDDYNKIMVKALADRLAEAFAEYLHERVRKVYWGYAPNENLSNEELIRENYQGIRPAPGYPACPEHTEKATIWELLEVEKHTGMKLTESFAMWPGASVSGWYFSHPDSKYYAVAQIQRDQVEDYARRKGMSVTEVERWLAPNLGYDAD